MTKPSTLKAEAWLEVLHLDFLLLTQNDVTRIFPMSTLLHSSFGLCLQNTLKTVPIAFQMKTGFGQVLSANLYDKGQKIYHNYAENMRDAGVKEIFDADVQ